MAAPTAATGRSLPTSSSRSSNPTRHAVPSCSAIAELTSAYHLGALEPDEAAEIEQHLDLCPPCRQLADGDRAVTDALALAVPQHTPPPRLRAGLMAAVRGERPPPSARRAEDRKSTRLNSSH